MTDIILCNIFDRKYRLIFIFVLLKKLIACACIEKPPHDIMPAAAAILAGVKDPYARALQPFVISSIPVITGDIKFLSRFR